jgi:redox-sensitive bicupin YhaK (pirin superfamily)
MEIVSYVVEGGLAHRDSLGNTGVTRAGDVQRMSAGTGIMHSEFNESDSQGLRFLQIWIPPERAGLPPSYEQKSFDPSSRLGRLALLVSPDGADGSLRIHQDARLYGAVLAPYQRVQHEVRADRGAWVQVVRGSVTVAGHDLEEGDGLGLADVAGVEIAARADAELLVFDLP